MSPRAILDASKAGQGSLYHHFRGKADLAEAALLEVEREMNAAADDAVRENVMPIQTIRSYLTAPRDALKGCRLGRLGNERTVISDGALRAPIARYFQHVEKRLARALREVDVHPSCNVDDVAASLVAVVQGGFVLARIHQDRQYMERATRGALCMVESLLDL